MPHALQRGADRPLRLVMALTAAYMVVEGIGGILTNSLALLSDAGHMVSDLAALLITFLALRVASLNAGPRHTYGYHRAEIFAALVNGIFLVIVALWIIYEAYQRFLTSKPVLGGAMALIAAGGLVVNIIGMLLLREASAHSLNVRGAFVHILGDLLGSVGALLAAGLILWRGWYLADAIISVIIAILIIFSSLKLLQEAVNVFMEGTPAHIDIRAVQQAMLETEGVRSIHDLHVWTIASGKDALSAHVVRGDGVSPKTLLQNLQRTLKERFGMSHLTIQIETDDFQEDVMHF